jgi:hypothetical protein
VAVAHYKHSCIRADLLLSQFAAAGLSLMLSALDLAPHLAESQDQQSEASCPEQQ